MKKVTGLLLSFVMLISCFALVPYSASAAQEGWVKEQYVDDSGTEYTFWFYCDSNGDRVTGWKKIQNVWYFFENEDKASLGLMYADCYYYDASAKALYHFEKSGAMTAGKWQKETGEDTSLVDWYYFTSSGKAASGWQKVGKSWYYFNTEDFSMYHSGLAEIGGKYYLFDTSGAMLTGWYQSGGYWWYFKASGELARGWTKVSNQWYYFAPLEPNDAEAMATGWRQISGKWYYFASSGAMQTGWQKISGKWYYFEASGAMRTANLTYKGKVYRFNASGACINP